ncbi:MAG: radical SAM protein, partial [Deltaproteobacteria bacterium]|nr:radical SAM protein [Deltaproteobacteria bacterium]
MFGKITDRPYPLNGQWELTCRCNLKCLMCYTDPFNTPERIRRELDFNEICRILDELHEEGCLYLCFTGGEPFARRDFLDIYAYARQKGFLLTVFTNGTLITPEVADFLKARPPRMIEISWHGFAKESFEKITQGKNSYERFREAVRLLEERNLPLTFKTTGMTLNRDEIFKIKNEVRKMGEHVQYRFGSDVIPRLDGSIDVFGYQLPAAEIEAIEAADPEFSADRENQD